MSAATKNGREPGLQDGSGIASVPSSDLESLKAEIMQRYEGLAKRLKQIARFALDNPNDIALETIAIIAERASVQPSSLVRFAKVFGYSGFSDMQRVFRAPLSVRTSSYAERVRAMRAGGDQQEADATTAFALLTDYIVGNIGALERLQQEVAADDLERAVDLLEQAHTVHLMGQRRAFPVAAYLAYTLSRIGVRAHLIDSIGGLAEQQGQQVRAGDVLVCVSFEPYSSDVANVASGARERGADVVAVTDSPVSPIGRVATVAFAVRDAEVRMFRSLAASMSLAQALAIALAYRLEEGS